MDKKIGIVTLYNACNYGSFLQAFGLQTALEKEGYDTSFIKVPTEYNTIVGKGDFSDQYVEYEELKYSKLLDDQKKFKCIIEANEHMDYCVIGSDTIWNMFDRAYESLPFFVGRGLNCDKVISYAASVGQSHWIKILLKNTRKLWPIRKIDCISVRDDKTERIVHLFGRKCTRVLDPTFLCTFEDQKPDIFIPDKYVLVYTYGLQESEILNIKEFANKKDLQIVATGSLCDWADYNPVVNSFEWLWLIKNASFVITNTFHGTVFSVKYNKELAVITTTSDKINSLAKELKINNRICTSENMTAVFDNKIDYDYINKIISDKVKKSKKYLKESLK